MNILGSFESAMSSTDMDRLQQENLALKKKVINLESHFGPDISSMQESTFAFEIHSQLKQRDSLLEKAKMSILSLQNETQMNSAMMEEKQTQIQNLQNQINKLTAEKQQLETNADMYQKQRDLKENELVLAKTKIQDLQTEISQSKFLIQNLHYRMNPDLNQEPTANTTTEQLWKDHLKAITHQMDAKIQEVQKKFSQNMDNVYQDKQDALQAVKKENIELESTIRQLHQQITDLKCVNVSLEEQNKHLNQQMKSQQNLQIELVHTQTKLNEETMHLKNLQLQNEQWVEKQKLLNAQNDELNSTLVNKNMLIEKCREKILKLSEGLKESLKENDGLEKQNKELQGKLMEQESIIRANQKILSDQETELSGNKKTVSEQKVQLDVLNNTVFELQQTLKRLQVNHDELQQIYDEKEREYNTYKNNYDAIKQANDKLSTLSQEQTMQMEMLSKQKLNNQSEIDDLTNRVKQYQQEIQQNLEKFTEVSVENGNLQTQVTELTTKLTELTTQKQISDLETDNNKQTIQMLQQQVLDLKDVNQRLQNDFDQVSLNYNVLKQQSGAQTTQLQENTNITTELRRKNQIMVQQLAQITQIMQEMSGQSMIKSLTDSYNALDSSRKNDELINQLTHFQSKFNELQNSLSEKKLKLQSLEQTNDNKDETLRGIQYQLDNNIQQIATLNQMLKEKTDQLAQVTRDYEQLKLQSDQNNLTLNQAVDQRNKLKEYQAQMKERIEKQDQIIKKLKDERSQLQKNVAAEVASATSIVRKAVQEFIQLCLSQNDLQVLRSEAVKLMDKINQ